jgi:adenosylhomocysteine nucleosidase
VLGIVTGLVFEADILRPYADLRVRAAGIAPNAAAAAAEALLAEGATALMSFGIAGGLDPAQEAGDIIVSAETRGARAIFGDTRWAATLSLNGIRNAPLAHTDIVLGSAVEKAALYIKSRAVAADMESYAVAEAAERRGVPFVALRAVADTARDTVPSVGIASMGADGRVRVGAAILGALTHPWQIPGLMLLGARTARAKEALAALARAHAPRRFGLG